LTVLPVPRRFSDPNPITPLFFPIVGWLRGGLFLIAVTFFPFFREERSGVLLLLAIEFILSRGLHWDGWSDTWDAIGALPKGKGFALQVLKDPRIGIFGGFFLGMNLLFKLELLWGIPPTGFLLYPPAGMLGILLPMGTLRYLRQQGTASAYTDRRSPLIAFGTLFCSLMFATVFFFPPFILPLILTTAGLLLSTFYLRKTFGGYTGDLLGWSHELGVLIFLAGFRGFDH
jgi:adenosylcobinamide-GDP ribazoletransferase